MTRRRKWILFPLGGLALLLVLLVVLFDWSWAKAVIEDQASSALGRPVTIGDLDVDLGLVSEITVQDLQIANAEWASDQPMANIPSATFRLDLLALLGGEIVLPTVSVDQPQVLLEQGEGRANWQFGAEEDPQGGGPAIPVIGDLQVSGAEVRYVDRVSDQEVVTRLETITGQAPAQGEIRLSAAGALGDAPLEAEFSAASRDLIDPGGQPTTFKLDGKIGGQTIAVEGQSANLLQAEALEATAHVDGAPPDELLTLLGLQRDQLPPLDLDAQIARDGQTLRIVRLEATLGASDLSGEGQIGLGEGPLSIAGEFSSNQIDIDQLKALWAGTAGDDQPVGDALANARAALEAAQAKGALEDQQNKAQETSSGLEDAAEGGLPELPFSFDRLPPWTVDVAYRAGTIRADDLRIEDLQAHARLEDQIPALSAQGHGSYAGQPVTLDVQLGPKEGVSASPFPIEAHAEAGETRLSLDGSIERPEELKGIELRFEAASRDLNEILAAAGVQAPTIPGFEASGRLIQENQTVELQDFQGQVGDSRLQGSASLDHSGETPLLTARIDAERLIAADFMPQDAQSDEDRGDGTPMLQDGRLNLAALPELDADIEFNGGVVEVAEFHFEPLQFDLRLANKIPILEASGQGTFRDAPMQFEATLGDERYLEDPSIPFAVDVELTAGEAHLAAQGTVAEPSGLAGLDVDVDLEGQNLDRIGDILQIPLPSSPPFTLAGALTHEAQTWTLDGLSGRIGDSTVAGRFSIDLAPERPTIVADLRSEHLDFDDLAPLIGAPGDTGEGETASPEQKAAAEEAEQDGRLLPNDALEVPDLKMMDARVQFRGENVDASKVPLGGVTMNVYLENGKLRLEPVRFELAGGSLDAKVMLDATPRPIEGSLDITVSEIHLQDLLSRFDIEVAEIDTQKEGKGTLFGRARLEVAGNSIAEMLGHADGQLSLVMDGGQVNALIVEAAGLDVGEALGLLVSDADEEQQTMVPVNCLVADFGVDSGVMQSKALVLDTPDSKIVGAGKIMLGEERLDLRFKALPRDTSVLTASTPVLVQGSFANPEVEVVTEELAEKGLAAAALGVVLPVVGAVLPFIEGGEKVPNNCARLLEQAAEARNSQAPEAASE